MKVFLALSAFGLIASAAVHVSTFVGVDPLDVFPQVWIFHLGIFVVLIPAIILGNRAPRHDNLSGQGLFDMAPRWVRVLTTTLFIYAMVNFALFVVLMREGGAQREPDGSFVVAYKGDVIRKIGEDEFHRLQAYKARGFSGHWMMFYAVGAAIIMSAMNALRSSPGSHAGPPRTQAARPVLAYAAAERHFPPIWLHQTLLGFCILIGFFGGPVTLALILRNSPAFRGALAIGSILASPVLGVLLLGGLFTHYVPARCPACGGAAYLAWATKDQYVCRQCRHTQREPN